MNLLLAPADIRQKEAAVRVQRGVALLDLKKPGWEQNVCLSTLQLSSTCHCVLGQVYGHFSIWIDLMPIGTSPGHYGFDTMSDGITFEELQAEWVKILTARQAPCVAWTHREPASCSIEA